MAGDWIKVRSDLQTHPKVVRIASALNADKFRAIGGLHAVWSLFDAHSADGQLEGYTPEVLDQTIGWVGFASAMKSVGWLIVEDGVLSLPRFDEHNGQSAKRRATDAQRKRVERAGNVREMSASNADNSRTDGGPEKRREEVIPSEAKASGGKPPDPPAVDPVKQALWRDAKALLMAQSVSKADAGEFIGRLVKDHGEAVALPAIRKAIETQPAEAKAWLMAACQTAIGKRSKHAGFASKDYTEGADANGVIRV